MNIQRVRTEWAHIIGKPKDDGQRTIVAKFYNFFMIFKIYPPPPPQKKERKQKEGGGPDVPHNSLE